MLFQEERMTMSKTRHHLSYTTVSRDYSSLCSMLWFTDGKWSTRNMFCCLYKDLMTEMVTSVRIKDSQTIHSELTRIFVSILNTWFSWIQFLDLAGSDCCSCRKLHIHLNFSIITPFCLNIWGSDPVNNEVSWKLTLNPKKSWTDGMICNGKRMSNWHTCQVICYLLEK